MKFVLCTLHLFPCSIKQAYLLCSRSVKFFVVFLSIASLDLLYAAPSDSYYELYLVRDFSYLEEPVNLSIEGVAKSLQYHINMTKLSDTVRQLSPAKELRESDTAFVLNRNHPNTSEQLSVYLKRARLYSKKGDYISALNYLEKSYLLMDSVYLATTSEKLDMLQNDFDAYKDFSEKKINEQKMELLRSNLQKKNLLIILLSFICMLILVSAVYFLQKIIHQRELNRILNEELNWVHIAEKERMEMHTKVLTENIDGKHGQLISDSLSAVQFTEVMESLKQKFDLLKCTSTQSGEMEILLNEVDAILKTFSPHEKWEEFRLLFKQLGKNFYDSLQKDYPRLTPLDQRLCALISLNLTTKEIASITNKSVRGIESAKCRLRRKMGGMGDSDLYNVIISYRMKDIF